MAPDTRTIASTSNNENGSINERLRYVEETLAQITRAMQEMVIINQGLNGDDVKGWIFRCEQFFSIDEIPENQKNGILQRFGTVFDDPVSEIRKIKYQSSVKEYQDAFDTQLSSVDVSEEHAVSFYLGGLPAKIKIGVRMFRPRTLADAHQLTNLQEATLEAINNSYGSDAKSSRLPLPAPNSSWRTKPNTPTSAPIRKQMTQNEYQEKRAQNLCFYCDQKYTPGHKCSGQLFSIVLLVDEELEYEEEYMEEESSMPNEVPQVSLNVLNGANSFQTIRITGKIGKHEWLKGKNQDKEFEGTTNAELLMFCVYPNTGVNLMIIEGPTKEDVMDLELSQAVDTFEDVFVVPTELPPQRSHDHKIPLLPNTQPINIRPYRHPPMQKDAIEVMEKELLDSGVIKPSNSPFASPIVMVKKKDNT
ncbi:hypothetical protein Tco_0491671 [Tanacetum coccineum]